jgi:hypothetical protein
MEFAVEAAFADNQNYQNPRWPIALGFGAAGCLTEPTARLFRRAPHPIRLDLQTGPEVLIDQRETCFFTLIHSERLLALRAWLLLLTIFGLVSSLRKSAACL